MINLLFLFLMILFTSSLKFEEGIKISKKIVKDELNKIAETPKKLNDYIIMNDDAFKEKKHFNNIK